MAARFLSMLGCVARCACTLQPGAGGPGWRPGAETLELRDDEKVIGPEAERHASCAFDVLDADEDHFIETFRQRLHRPMLIKNMIKHWPALTRWTSPDFFKEYARGKPQLKILPWNVSSLNPMERDVANLEYSPTRLAGPAIDYFVLANEQDTTTGMYKEPTSVIFDHLLSCDDSLLAEFAPLPDIVRSVCVTRFTTFEAFGVGHGMHRHPASWSVQVVGNKSWYMFPPKVGEYKWETWAGANDNFGFPSEEQPVLANTYCGYRPVRKLYRDNLHFCVQAPGEAVYLPDFWWHATCSLENYTASAGVSINITCSFPDGCDNFLMKEYLNSQPAEFPHEDGSASQGLGPEQPADLQQLSDEQFSPLLMLESVEDRLGFPMGSPGVDNVLNAIDGYCIEEQWVPSCFGNVRGALVEEIVAEWANDQNHDRSLLAVDFGSGLGYAAMRIAKRLPAGGNMSCVESTYSHADRRITVEKFLSWSQLSHVVKFFAQDRSETISTFAQQGLIFDVISLSHGKEHYWPILRDMTSKGQLRFGTLFLAQSVVAYDLKDLLQHLRFSREFKDFRLYYMQSEHHKYHKRAGHDTKFYPDGLTVATYAGPGQGESFDSPGAPVCETFKDCVSCVVSLCGWCQGNGKCVPDVPGGQLACENVRPLLGASREGGPLVGVFGSHMRCDVRNLGSEKWVGPRSASGLLRQGGLDSSPPFANRSTGGRTESDSSCKGAVSCGKRCAATCSHCGTTLLSCTGDCMWGPDKCVEAAPGSVKCGGHSRPTCSDCPMEFGQGFCHGECDWIDGQCVPARIPTVATHEL